MALLIDRWVAFDQTSSGLEKWLSQFGDEPTSSNLMTKINANGSIEETEQLIEQIIQSIIQRKQSKQKVLRSSVQSIIIREEEIEAEK